MRVTSLIIAAIVLATPVAAQELRGPDAFNNIENRSERSQALFNETALCRMRHRAVYAEPRTMPHPSFETLYSPDLPSAYSA